MCQFLIIFENKKGLITLNYVYYESALCWLSCILPSLVRHNRKVRQPLSCEDALKPPWSMCVCTYSRYEVSFWVRNTQKLSVSNPQLCMPGSKGQEVGDSRTSSAPWAHLASGSLPFSISFPRSCTRVNGNSFPLQSRERQKKKLFWNPGMFWIESRPNIVLKILDNKNTANRFESAENNE
jgi:hypothetical protein